eukprot:357475-Chlamydomonas_euryale.AAC.1
MCGLLKAGLCCESFGVGSVHSLHALFACTGSHALVACTAHMHWSHAQAHMHWSHAQAHIHWSHAQAHMHWSHAQLTCTGRMHRLTCTACHSAHPHTIAFVAHPARLPPPHIYACTCAGPGDTVCGFPPHPPNTPAYTHTHPRTLTRRSWRSSPPLALSTPRTAHRCPARVASCSTARASTRSRAARCSTPGVWRPRVESSTCKTRSDVVLARTSFYAEHRGQVFDTGSVAAASGELGVQDAQGCGRG